MLVVAVNIMEQETIRMLITTLITAISTLGAAAIVAYFGYRTVKLRDDQEERMKEIDYLVRKLRDASEEIKTYYELEDLYSKHIENDGDKAQKTIKSEFRTKAQERTGRRISKTKNDMDTQLRDLSQKYGSN